MTEKKITIVRDGITRQVTPQVAKLLGKELEGHEMVKGGKTPQPKTEPSAKELEAKAKAKAAEEEAKAKKEAAASETGSEAGNTPANANASDAGDAGDEKADTTGKADAQETVKEQYSALIAKYKAAETPEEKFEHMTAADALISSPYTKGKIKELKTELGI